MNRKASSTSEWSIRLGLILSSTILALLFAFLVVEGILQFKHRNSYSVLPYGMRGDNIHETLYIGFRPNFVGTNKKHGIEYRTNQLGIRDDPIEPSTDQLIFLGDSTTFGLNIRHEDTYAERVEHRLKERGYAISSVNTASPGQGTISQLRVLDELWDKTYFRPKAIILGFFHNDFSNNLWHEHYLRSRRNKTYDMDMNTSEKVPITTQKFPFKLYTPMRIKAYIEILRGDYAPKSLPKRRPKEFYQQLGALNAQGEYTYRPGREVEWDWLSKNKLLNNRSYRVTLKALEEIIKLCKERGITFIFLYLPSGEKEILSGKSPLYKSVLREELRKFNNVKYTNNVIYIDVLKVYRDYLAERKMTSLPSRFYSVPGDAAHPGPLANTLIANALEPVIVQALESGT